MDSPGQVSNEFRRKLREEGKSKREQLLDSSKIATGYKFSAPQLSPRIQPGFFTASVFEGWVIFVSRSNLGFLGDRFLAN
jgi:hypothetical protein